MTQHPVLQNGFMDFLKKKKAELFINIAFFNTSDNSSGSARDYVKDKIGIIDEDIGLLRTYYLV